MTFTNEEVAEAVQMAVEEKGESYIYDEQNLHSETYSMECVYANADDEPSCIVGHVLYALNPEAFKRVVEFERDGEANRGDTSFNAVADNVETGLTTEQVAALFCAQASQDGGNQWGTARDAFMKRMGKA